MDEDQKALNTEPDQTEQTESPKVEEKQSETDEKTIEQEALEPTGEKEEVQKETEVEDKKSANARIRELNAEKKQAIVEKEAESERAESLAEQLAKLTGEVSPQGDNTPYQSQIEPGVEVTQEQYREDVAKTADSIVQLRLAQQKTIDRINSEGEQSISTYKQLDPKDEQFDPDLSQSVSEAALAYVRVNPTGSVKKFVDNLMKPYMRSIEKQVGEHADTVTKQIQETALRPTQGPKGEKKFSELTLEEMEERLGKVS